MARLIPNKPVGNVSSETAKVLHALRRVPGEDLLVWIAMPLGSAWRPALMTIYRQASCHLIAVSAMSEAQVNTVLHGDLFAESKTVITPADLERQTRDQLQAFRQCALVAADAEYNGARLPIFPVVAFPNVPQALLDELVRKGAISDCQLWGRETIRTETLLHRIGSATVDRPPLPDAVLDALREKFTPEIGIPDALVARVQEKPERSTGPKLTGFLLDLDQEFLAKEDLTFSSEADAALREMRLRLVTGVAGSGKSLILLYRAMLQAKLHPEARMLILTHNKPLNGELRERFRRLCPGSGAEWATFYQWCRNFAGAQWKIIKPWEAETLLRDLATAHPALSRLPLNFLSEEIDWIRDQGLSTRDEYLTVARLGRKRPLQDEHRCAMFSLLEKYRAELDRGGLEDWAGAAAAVWQRVQRGLITPPVYDFVFIDEAQFFAPTWFHLVKRCVRPGTGQLFLAADPTQGFLKRRQSWSASGLDVRGQSARLHRCYRNTREILQFATTFYKSRLAPDEEEINLPEPADIARLTSGEAPRFLQVDSSQGERSRVANEIAAALLAGASPEHFLVLQSESALVAPFIQTLNNVVGRPIARDLKDSASSSAGVRVCSLNAATGLESPVVFFCGVDGLLEKEDALGVAGDERSELVRDNTRRIYMAMTRASRKLIVTHRRPATRQCLEARDDGDAPPSELTPKNAEPHVQRRATRNDGVQDFSPARRPGMHPAVSSHRAFFRSASIPIGNVPGKWGRSK